MHFFTRVAILILLAVFGCQSAPPKAPPAAAPSPAQSPAPDALDYDQLLMAAQGYLDVSRPIDAASVAADAAHMEPKRPDAYIMWGRALSQADQLAEAAQHYEEARALGSRDASLFAELASVYDVAKRYTEAMAIYRDFLTDHPTDITMRDELALTLLLVNKAPEAVAELKTAQQNAPTNLQIQQDLGYAQLQAAQYAAARDTLELVVKTDPHRGDAMRFLAQAYLGLNDKAHARALLTQLLAAYPRDRAANALMERLDDPPQPKPKP